jgi:hypothetical protein
LTSAALAAGNGAAQSPLSGVAFREGLIFVSAEIGGVSGRFLLDTGAARTVLDERFAEAAGVRLGRRRDIEGRGGDIAARQGERATLRLEGGPSAMIAPVATDLSPASRAMGEPLAGILGEDVLGRFVVVLDYRDQTVALLDVVQDPSDATPIRVAVAPYAWARATLAGRMAEGEFQIDTGSNTAVEFWRPFARAAFGSAPASPAMGLGVAGESPIERGRIDRLEVAGHAILSPEVNFADETRADDAGPDYGGVIGGPAWSGLVLTLDLPGRRMWVR